MGLEFKDMKVLDKVFYFVTILGFFFTLKLIPSSPKNLLFVVVCLICLTFVAMLIIFGSYLDKIYKKLEDL